MILSRSTPRRLFLASLVLFLLGWDLWAIWLDGRLKLPDTFVMHTLQLWQAMGADAAGVWLANLGPKGPLGPVLALPLLWIFGKAPFAMRLVTVLAHAVLVWQSYDVGRNVWGKPSAGLWAALLCGTCPFLFGICRLAYHDVLLGVAVIGSIQLMLRVKLDRAAAAMALGLVLGLGLLTKHSFSLYMVGPGLWFMARRVRSVRTVAYLGLMVAVMVATAAVWAVPNFNAVFENLFANTSLPDVPWSAELGFYLSLPGAAPLFIAAVLSVVALGLTRRVSLWSLVLLLSFIPMVVGLHSVTAAARYMIPVIPLWSVLAGCGLAWLLERPRVPPRVHDAALAATTLALLGVAVALNLTGIQTEVAREDYGGIISPDTRKYDGYARALQRLRTHGPDVLLAFDSVAGYCERDGHEILAAYHGLGINPIQLADARKRVAAGRGVSVLYVRRHPQRPLAAKIPPDLWPPVRPGEHSSLSDLAARVRWLARSKRRKLAGATRDPDGYQFQAWRVGQ